MTEQTGEMDKQEGGGYEASGDNRRYARYRVSLPVHVKLSSGEVAKAKAVEISTDGIYIEYGASAEEGKVFEMLFDLPFANDFKRVYVKSKVMRAVVIGGKDAYGIACNFVEFARDTDKVLEKYIELRSLKQAP